MWMKQLWHNLRKTKKNLSKESQYLDLDSNRSLPEYKPKELQTEPTFLDDLLNGQLRGTTHNTVQ